MTKMMVLSASLQPTSTSCSSSNSRRTATHHHQVIVHRRQVVVNTRRRCPPPTATILPPLAVLIALLTTTLTAAAAASSSSSSSVIGRAVQLQCPPCERVHCSPRRPSQLQCRGGVVRGVCNCCPVCAKLDGEPCGGQWNYLGRCDAGLYCDAAAGGNQFGAGAVVLRDVDPLEAGGAANGAGVGGGGVSIELLKVGRRADKMMMNSVWKSEGRCRKGHELSDSPQPLFKCFPQCTPHFCRQNVKALCSAVDNADRKQSCQGDCQHTSCSACRFVRANEPDCLSAVRCASPSDTDCLRRFGRCMRRQQCRRAGFPCKIENKQQDDLKFLCIVPECSSSSRP